MEGQVVFKLYNFRRSIRILSTVLIILILGNTFAFAEDKDVLILNDDIMLQPNCIEKLEQFIQERDEIAHQYHQELIHLQFQVFFHYTVYHCRGIIFIPYKFTHNNPAITVTCHRCDYG